MGASERLVSAKARERKRSKRNPSRVLDVGATGRCEFDKVMAARSAMGWDGNGAKYVAKRLDLFG